MFEPRVCWLGRRGDTHKCPTKCRLTPDSWVEQCARAGGGIPGRTKGSNDDWTHPHDPDAKITKMKDGRTHLAHKAEHAVDLDTGAVVVVTVQDADEGDTTTSIETLIDAAEKIETVVPDGNGLEEVVGDKGYHSNQALVDLEAVGVRSYVSEPYRGRRNWTKNPKARDAVYRNRRRIWDAGGRTAAAAPPWRNPPPRVSGTRLSRMLPESRQRKYQ